MFEFFAIREKISAALCDGEAQNAVHKDIKNKAGEVITRFLKRNRHKHHFLPGMDKNFFYDPEGKTLCDESGMQKISEQEKIWYGALHPCFWMDCKKIREEEQFKTFNIKRSLDVVTLFRIKGKGIWKISIGNQYQDFPVYLKKSEKSETFCIEPPFPLFLVCSQFNDTEVKIYGEVERLQMKGLQIKSSFRQRFVQEDHKFFYGAVTYKGGCVTFLNPKEDAPLIESTLFLS